MCNCAPGALRICASSPESVPEPVEDLTEKEKEALRLLREGLRAHPEDPGLLRLLQRLTAS